MPNVRVAGTGGTLAPEDCQPIKNLHLQSVRYIDHLSTPHINLVPKRLISQIPNLDVNPPSHGPEPKDRRPVLSGLASSVGVNRWAWGTVAYEPVNL